MGLMLPDKLDCDTLFLHHAQSVNVDGLNKVPNRDEETHTNEQFVSTKPKAL